MSSFDDYERKALKNPSIRAEHERLAPEFSALDQLDGRGSEAEWAAIRSLRQEVGDRLPTLLLAKYRSSTRAGTRASCVYHAIQYAKTSEDAVQLGREALRDRAKAPRYRACMLLAYSQQPAVLPDLRAALAGARRETQANILAAIDAIESRNHHFFVDRKHSGMVTLTIG